MTLSPNPLARRKPAQVQPLLARIAAVAVALIKSLDASLRRLRTDRIDLLWVHLRDTLTPVGEVMRALDDQVRAGKVLYGGSRP